MVFPGSHGFFSPGLATARRRAPSSIASTSMACLGLLEGTAVMRQPSFDKWLIYGYFMANIWLLYGKYMVIIWEIYG
jgi:hypothetical protein